MARVNVPGNSPWESVIGFSRAVRAGGRVCVSGTTATGDGGAIVGKGDAYAQAAQAMRNVEAALGQAGASLADVVRTRIYVMDIADWEAVARAHREAFGSVRPAATLVEISRLADPDALVEIEADAVIANGAGGGG